MMAKIAENENVLKKIDDKGIKITVFKLSDDSTVILTFNGLNFPVLVSIDNLDYAKSLSKAIQAVIDHFEKLEKEEAKKPPKFIVPYSRIFVTSAFKNSHPAPEKIMKCLNYYTENETFDRDIVVQENLILTDGYVAYLVGGFVGIKNFEVVAPKGINVRLGNKVYNFMSDKIVVMYDDSLSMLALKSGDSIHKIVCNRNDVVKYLSTIYDIFRADFIFVDAYNRSNGEEVIISDMKKANIPCIIS